MLFHDVDLHGKQIISCFVTTKYYIFLKYLETSEWIFSEHKRTFYFINLSMRRDLNRVVL